MTWAFTFNKFGFSTVIQGGPRNNIHTMYHKMFVLFSNGKCAKESEFSTTLQYNEMGSLWQ